MADSIKVVVLENDFAALCRLGLPVSLSLQLQQSGLKLADALWTVRSSGSGFSVSLFWPSDIRTSKWGRRKGKAVKTVKKDNKKARKNAKVLATTSVTSAATATNQKLQLMPSSQYCVGILQKLAILPRFQ